LPIDFNLQELQLADQYNDEIVTSIEVDSLQAMPTQPFDIDETLPPSTMPTLATAPSLTSLTGDEDDSEVLPHQRAVNTTPTRFRPQYKALLEILRMPELQQEVHKLPSCLSTLKRQTTSELPLLPMRKKSSIPLQPDQLAKEKPSHVPETLPTLSTTVSQESCTQRSSKRF
jgi:hypothetical protein